MPTLNLIKPAVKPKYSLFIPWTRWQFADPVLKSINDMELPTHDMEVVFYIDTDERRVYDRLLQWAMLNQYIFNGIKLIKSGNPQPVDLDHNPTADIYKQAADRRDRIVEMKEASREYLEGSDLIFGLEDDTVAPHYAFTQLKKHIKGKTVFAQGVQMGRWGLNVLGAWQVNDLADPTEVKTVMFDPNKATSKIDGGGLFCFVAKMELHQKHKWYWHDECFGPDMTFGLGLRNRGYDCVMDNTVVCKHHTDQGVLTPSPGNLVSIKWTKQGSNWIR